MERLWSPWRLEYVIGDKSPACVFCLDDARHSAEERALQRSLVVYDGVSCFVILNLYPYNNGHLMVVPHRHVPSLAALTSDELQEIAVLTQRSEVALYEAYRPQGINAGINLGKPAGAGVENHLHVHLVPRWNGDTNFMTVVGNMRVLPEDLSSSAERLRPIFARLAAAATSG
jgi:ATP adenylyltransferase